MHNAFYDLIHNSAVLFSLWNYKTLKNSVKATQTVCLCVCARVKEKNMKGGERAQAEKQKMF